MNEQQLQQAFLQFLAQKTGAKTQQELEAAIQQMGEQGLQQAYQEFMQLMQQQQVQAAKFGAKLNYIRMLRGQCPEGYEMQYYKTGGRLCKKCVQKAMSQGGSMSEDPIDQFKCGRKMKKKEQGGPVDYDKCGKKMKKKESGGNISFDKCGKKMKKKEVGGNINFDKCGKKMKKKANGGTFDISSFDKTTLAKCGAKLKKAACGSKMKKDQKGNKLTKPNKLDKASRDSIEVNKYGNQDIETKMPGNYKKNKQGKVQWTPDRSKSPYNKK